MRVGRTAFFLREYNDIDHIAPVVWKFIKEGDNPIIVFVTDIDYVNDYRVQYISSVGELEIIKDIDEEYVYYSSSNNNGLIFRIKKKLYSLKRDPGTIIGKLYRKLSFSCKNEIDFMLAKNVAQCVFEWGTPFERGEKINKYFIAAKGQGITTYCLPHGCNLFTHSDVNQGYRRQIVRGFIPSQVYRNEYDYFIFQNPHRRDGWVKWGYNPVKTFAWGSARWDFEWQKINQAICPKFQSANEPDGRFKIVFMQYQANYNINENKIWSLLGKIASDDRLYLVIKDSTRSGAQYASNEFNQDNMWRNNIEFVGNEAHSPSLIEWSDCVIAFGSSIGIEVLIQNKHLINPHYLISNRTYYEEYSAAFNADDEDEVVKHINTMISDPEYKISDYNKSLLYKEFLFGGRSEYNVIDYYYRKISSEYLDY